MRFAYRIAARGLALALLQPAIPALAANEPAASATALPDQAAFHATVIKTYSIDSKRLKDKAYSEASSAAMTGLWKLASANPKHYAPLLAAELALDGQPADFYLDGPLLLHLLDPSPEMGKVGAAALTRVDFGKINLNPANYLISTNYLMADGVDTSDAALHILDFKGHEFMVDLFPHVFFYGKTEALVWGLFGLDEALFVPKLAARLETETDPHNLGALIHALWEAATPEAWAALHRYEKLPGKPKDAQKYVREMFEHQGDAPPAADADPAKLREARRKLAKKPFAHRSYNAFHKHSDDLVTLLKKRGALQP
jgi:hypothetical protein